MACIDLSDYSSMTLGYALGPAQQGIDISIDSGVPYEQIFSVSQDIGADILVLGPKGRSRSARFSLGSTIEKIFRHSPVPVLRLGPDIIH